MARFKPARGPKQAPPKPGAISCIVLIVIAFLLFYLVLYYSVKSA